MLSRRGVAVLATALITLAACGGGTATPSASPSTSASASAVTAEKPTRPVEFVISTAPGGGSDTYARIMQGVIEKLKLSPQPVNPVNKPGGSGAVAFQYVFEKKGDMHYVMITLNSFWTTLITTKPALPYKPEDFTPIANLANDPFFLWVNEKSPWKTAGDLIAEAKNRPLIATGTGSKQEDEVLFRRIQDVAGTKAFNYVPDDQGGGHVATALRGQQAGIEVTVNNPSEGLPGYQATPREIRPLCTFQPQSPTTGPFAGLATCKSQGLPIDDYYVVRAIMAAPGLSAAQQKFWVDVFKGVYDSQEWKDFAAKNVLDLNFVSGDAFKKLVQDLTKVHTDIAQKNGWL
ncbi:MAG: tripartite tricarboxylate transporter substrate binding protein [Chloroflexi bacterium]|nr:MAG: tripartite tricarboxylate transporter substrate binding protein [Chloroflexota bacterium]